MVAESVFEIEIDSPNNGNLYFLPMGSKVRGRFEVGRFQEPESHVLAKRFPNGIPGQRIGWDFTNNEGYIKEPIHGERALKASLERQGFGLEPEYQSRNTHKATWLFWMKRAVESNHARVVAGCVPSKIEGEPKLSQLGKRIDPDKQKYDTLTSMMEQMIASNTAVVAAIGELAKSVAAKK